MVKDKWTVIIRTFCTRDYTLLESLYSLYMLQYKNLEVVIAYHIDDEELYKKTSSKVEKFKSILTIKEFHLKKDANNLRSKLLNMALKELDSEFLSFLDDDDVFYPEFLNIVNYARNNIQYNFVYGNSLTAKIKPYKEFNYAIQKFKGHGEEFNKIKFILDNFIPINTFVIRTQLIGESLFDEKIDVLEDWDFLASLVAKAEFNPKYLNIDVSEYRRPIDFSNTGFTPANEKMWQETRKYVLEEKIFNKNYILKKEDLLVFSKHYFQILSGYNSYYEISNSKTYKFGVFFSKLFNTKSLKPVLMVVRKFRLMKIFKKCYIKIKNLLNVDFN